MISAKRKEPDIKEHIRVYYVSKVSRKPETVIDNLDQNVFSL